MRSLRSRLRRDTGKRSLVFEVGGMTCGSCAARIEGVLSDQPGVKSAVVDFPSKQARLSLSGDASTDGIVAAVEKAGYTVDSMSADG